MKIAYVEPGKQDQVIGESVFSEEELLARLDVIRSKYLRRLDHPIGVDLIAEKGDYLSVGLGADESIIFYYPAEGEGVVLNSLGDENAEGTVVFYFCQWTELSRKYVVPWEKAEEVVRHWFRTGQRSEIIRWTDRIF